MSNYDQTRVYFGVFGFNGSPSVITKTVGINPTEQWVKGDPYGEHGGIRMHSRWELRSPAASATTFETKLDALLDLLEQRAESIREVAESYDAAIVVVEHFLDEYNPGYHLSASAISRISDLGLSVDFDLYFPNETA